MFVFHVSVTFTRTRRKVFMRLPNAVREEFNIVAKNEQVARSFLESSFGKDVAITFEDSAVVHVVLPNDDNILLLTHPLSMSRQSNGNDKSPIKIALDEGPVEN